MLIPRLPADFPVPVAMVLHMPVGYTELYARKLERAVGAARRRGAGDGEVVAGHGATLRRRPASDAYARQRRPRRDAPRRAAARHAAPAVGRRAVSVGRRGVRAACPGRRHDRHGQRRPRGRGVDQGEGRTDPHRGGGELRRLRHAAIGRRGGLERRSRPARADGRGDHGDAYERRKSCSSTTRAWRAAARGAILEAAGYEVVEAEDGLVGARAYFVEKPDVVMLDLVMKGMYGLDVLAKLREMDPGARASSSSPPTSRPRRARWSRRPAPRGFLNKPVDRAAAARRGRARRSRRRAAWS